MPWWINANVARIINSDEVQSVLRPKLDAPKKHASKKEPLKSKSLMEKLNPGSTQKRMLRKRASDKTIQEARLVQTKRTARMATTKSYNSKGKKGDHTYYKKIMKEFEGKAVANKDADDEE